MMFAGVYYHIILSDVVNVFGYPPIIFRSQTKNHSAATMTRYCPKLERTCLSSTIHNTLLLETILSGRDVLSFLHYDF